MVSKVVTRDQLIRLGALSPQSIYNRIILCTFSLGAGGGASFAYTPNLGSKIWLKGILVFIDGQREDPEHLHGFHLKKGDSPPKSADEILEWEDVIQYSRTQWAELHTTFQARAEFYFPISKLYDTAACHFGIWGSAGGGGLHIYAAYWVYTEG